MTPCARCEVCGAAEWVILGQRVYRRRDRALASRYVRHRLTVLFDVWLRESSADAEIEVEAAACSRCALAVLRPRPTVADIDAKYAALGRLGEFAGTGGVAPDSARELERSSDLWTFLREYVEIDPPGAVLDFGGGDGRLMNAFAAAGCTPFLVDYRVDTVPWVDRLGATIDEVEPGMQFDVILASHVLEHVAEPRMTAEALVARLHPGGYLFAEVPLEMWDRPPLPAEPVTHINFFTPNAIMNLFGLSGLDPGVCVVDRWLHPDGHRKLGIRIIGAKPAADEALPPWKLLSADDIPLFRR